MGRGWPAGSEERPSLFGGCGCEGGGGWGGATGGLGEREASYSTGGLIRGC